MNGFPLITLALIILLILFGLFMVYKYSKLVKELRRSEDLRSKAVHQSHVKSLFLANMSHEIRTPLGAMMGFADLLDDENLPSEERSKYLKIIRSAGLNLTGVINDILDISKIESGHLDISKANVHLFELLEDMKRLLTLRCQQKGVNLVFHLDESLPSIIHTDQLRLKQILLNILGNAIKFTEEGWVSLEARMCDDKITFDVRDTGIGITESARTLIFEPFKQGEENHTRTFGGTGLGIPLSKHLAELLGGDLRLLSSRISCGSHFQIRVNYERPENEITDLSAKILPQEPVSLFGIRVLAVDDSEDNRCLIKAVLKGRGCDVHEAENGREAMAMMASCLYDVVLMDLQMPVMDGIKAVEAIRAKGNVTPVIALTARAMTEDAEQCARAGFNDFQSKPIQFESLMNKISKYRRVNESARSIQI